MRGGGTLNIETISPQYGEIMRKDALCALRQMTELDRKKTSLAISAVCFVAEFVKKEGFVALSSDPDFRRGGAYVLDAFEKEKHCRTPLRIFLENGLEVISDGQEVAQIEYLVGMEYLISGYTGADSLVSYIYLLGLIGITQGICPEEIADSLKAFVEETQNGQEP